MSEPINSSVSNGAAVATSESFSIATSTGKPAATGTSMPESVRSLAETLATQNREIYERTRESMEDAIDVLETTFDKAGQGTAALNKKVMDIAQTNINSGFDLAKELASVRSLTEYLEIQSTFMRSQFEQLSAQAGEVRELAMEVADQTSAPAKEHLTRTFDAARDAS